MHVPDLGALLQEAQSRRLALEATGVYFISEIDPPHAEDLFRSLLLMALPREGPARISPSRCYINSGGGSLGDGLAMMEFINRMRHDYDVRIDTAVLGYAYSMGAVVLQAGDHRTIGRFGTLMLHSTSWIISGDDERIFKDFQRLCVALPGDGRPALRRADGPPRRRLVATLHLVRPRPLPAARRVPRAGARRRDRRARARRRDCPARAGACATKAEPAPSPSRRRR